MIISDRHKFVFIHVPKCGGTTVRRRIEALDDRHGRYNMPAAHPTLGRIDMGHIPLFTLREHFAEEFETIRGYRSFAVVRNPFERFASSLTQQLKMYGERPLRDLPEHEVEIEIDRVIDFLFRTRPEGLLPPEYIHFQPQVDFLRLDGRRWVQSIYPLHRIGDLFEDLAALRVGAPLAQAGDGRPNDNSSITFRSDLMRGLIKGLRPTIGRIAAMLPEAAKGRLRKLVYVRRDERFGELFHAPRVQRFIEKFYRDDIALWTDLNNGEAPMRQAA